MTASQQPGTTPLPSGTRRVRTKRHSALRTRRGLAVGTVVATAGLTGAYWVGDLATTTTAASSGSTSSSATSSSSSSSSSSTTDSSTFDDTTTSFESDVDVAPSAAAPDTSSRAS